MSGNFYCWTQDKAVLCHLYFSLHSLHARLEAVCYSVVQHAQHQSAVLHRDAGFRVSIGDVGLLQRNDWLDALADGTLFHAACGCSYSLACHLHADLFHRVERLSATTDRPAELSLLGIQGDNDVAVGRLHLNRLGCTCGGAGCREGSGNKKESSEFLHII